MDITLYEKIDKTKLEQVLMCDNIPFENSDDENWKDNFKKILTLYSKKRYTKQGIEIKYKQINKYGRYCCYRGIGLQAFQKDVRKYISGEYYDDIDIVNCHPVLLNQLLKKYNTLGMSALDEYCNNREQFLNQHNITKIDMIKLINYGDSCNKVFFEKIYNQIYKELVPILKKEHKVLFDRIKKSRKNSYNYEGSFLSHYLQNIENEIIMIIYKHLNNKGYVVGSLMFDGLMVEKTDSLCDELKDLERLVKDSTGYDITLVLKSTKTNWKPNTIKETDDSTDKEEDLVYSAKENSRLYDLTSYKDAEGVKHYDYDAIEALHQYINNFVCKINYPHSYGWRNNTSNTFELRSSEKVKDRIRFGFEINDRAVCWKNSDSALLYDRFVFCINENDMNPDEYNLYQRPKMKEHSFDNLADVCHELDDYLLNVVSSGDKDVYTYLLHYFAKMCQNGKTEQLLVLMGKKGCGKSTLCEFGRLLIGNEYYQKVDDINQISNHFNALYEKTILTSVEEIVANAGEYHSVQSKLKTLTTEKLIKIEKKGVDAYMSKSNNNFILCTNEFNPVKITQDNRRNMIIEFSNVRQNDYNYFKELLESIHKNIEQIRYFFYKFSYNTNLNTIRPCTSAEKEILLLNENSAEKFIKDFNFGKKGSTRLLELVYSKYLTFCKENHLKIIDSRYFSKELKKFNFDTERKGTGNNKYRYIIGNEDNYSEEVVCEIDESHFI
jgi:hypothetical protein